MWMLSNALIREGFRIEAGWLQQHVLKTEVPDHIKAYEKAREKLEASGDQGANEEVFNEDRRAIVWSSKNLFS